MWQVIKNPKNTKNGEFHMDPMESRLAIGDATG